MANKKGPEGPDNLSDADKYRRLQAQWLNDLADAYKNGAISQQELEAELSKKTVEPGEPWWKKN